MNQALTIVARLRMAIPGIVSDCWWMVAVLAFLCVTSGKVWADDISVHHDLSVTIELEAKKLHGEDEIRIGASGRRSLSFLIAPQARILAASVNHSPAEYSFRGGRLLIRNLASPGDEPWSVQISYEAKFDDPLPVAPVRFDNPGFGVAGTITEAGVFLLPGSGWYPQVVGSRSRFSLKVIAPRGIIAVTAGRLVREEQNANESISCWEVEEPIDGLALSAGPYHIASLMAGRTPVHTYFFQQTAQLSNTYLKAAAAHIRFYDDLHGPYPFSKFAVVENFFPTGYGFPSYTLLGTSVLRLPFIPETSLKHEVAHSWWGNGVLVDYDTGNWCEGLTTYVADYLSNERIAAADGRRYRQQILRDYATLAASGQDLPLKDFIGRVSPATRAVGYGKAAFVFHMVRQKIGDDAFWLALRRVYHDRLFMKTSWRDFQNVFQSTGEWDELAARQFFDQWLNQPGAPVLELNQVRSQKTGDGWSITGMLRQKPPYYHLQVPIYLSTAQRSIVKEIQMIGESAAFSFQIEQHPQKLEVDPESNLFRLLYPEEIPATVNSVKGSRDLVAVFSASVPWNLHGAFQLLLTSLNQQNIRIVPEKDVEPRMTATQDVFFFGVPQSEKLKKILDLRPADLNVAGDRFSLANEFSSAGADCLFTAFGDPQRPGRFIALFLPIPGTDEDSVITAVRKITHYGKYSYLTFLKGMNRSKGVWEITRSPLISHFEEES